MKLLVLDVEGTLFKSSIRLPGTNLDSTIWQGIAHSLGPNAICEEIETHKKWSEGKYKSYLDWMKDTIRIHKKYGLDSKTFEQLISCSSYNDGVVETLKSINRQRYEIVLISGGFRELATRAQRDIGIIHAFAACEYQFGNDGLLHTYNLLPCDFNGKVNFVNLMLKEYGLGSNDWIFVGDGANDVPIAKTAPLSVGFNPHPDLSEVVSNSIYDFRELLSIL
jgi:phosphoserine phosphatase